MVDMNKIRALIAFVDMRDPFPDNDEEPGPLLSQLLSAAKGEHGFDIELAAIYLGSKMRLFRPS